MPQLWLIVKQAWRRLWSFRSFRRIFILVIIYKFIFNPVTGQILFKEGFAAVSPGTLSLDVKQFSLFYGIEIQNLELQNAKEMGGDVVCRISRLAFLYNLPLLLTGRLKLSEIAIESPEIYLKKQNNLWNFEKLFPNKSKEEEEKKEDSPSSEEINLYLPVSAFARFHIDNVLMTVDIEDPENPLNLKIKDINANLLLDTFRFRKIPLSLKAIDIIEILEVSLNPEKSIPIYYKDKEEILDAELDIKLILKKEPGQVKKIYSSALLFSTKKFLVKKNLKPEETYNFELGYNLIFQPEADELRLASLHFVFEKERWLHAFGALTKISSPTPDFDFVVSESKINLNSLSPLIKAVPGLSGASLGGNISLAGISAKGDIDNLNFIGKIIGNGIFYNDGKTNHSIPKLNLAFHSHWNFSDKTESNDEDILPILEDFKLEILNVIYNGIELKLSGEIQPKSKVDLVLDVSGVYLEKFSPSVSGNAQLKTLVTGNKLSYLNLDTKAEVRGLKYKMGRGVSGYQKILISLQTVIDLGGGFKFEDMQVEPLDISLWNENNEKAISLNSHLDLDMKSGLKASIIDLKLSGNMTKLLPTLPLGLKNTISGIRSGLGNELGLGGNIVFESFPEKDHILLNLTGSFPAIELKDLKLGIDVNLNKDKAETIEIKQLHLDAFGKKLKADYKGKFYKPFTSNPPFGDMTGVLDGNLTLESEEPKHILKGIHFKGDLDFDLHIKENIITGKLHTNDSHFNITKPCPQAPCPAIEIKGLHLDIPFIHDILDKTTENLTQGNKEQYIQNYGNTQTANFSIQSISAPHPSKPTQSIDFVSPRDGFPGLSGRLDYKDNHLLLDNLRIFSLNGSIFGRDILFNVGDGDTEKMQFAGVLQIRDVDFKQLLDEKSQAKIDDGKIKADLNFSGENIDDPIGNMDLYFTIFQIGKDFGKSVVNIVSPTNIIKDFIINSYSVNKVEVELSKGLVYAKVQFDKTLLNRVLFQIEDDRIKQERIPLASFLKRAKNELESYNY